MSIWYQTAFGLHKFSSQTYNDIYNVHYIVRGCMYSSTMRLVKFVLKLIL